MGYQKITASLILIILLTSLALAAESNAEIINSPPTLSITSMNLNPGTNRDIYPYISDENDNNVTCSYCTVDACYTVCRIYAPQTPGVHRIDLKLNDTIDEVTIPFTLFVPGEVPSSSSGGSGSVQSLPENNIQSPNNEDQRVTDEINQREEESQLNQTTPRNETPNNITEDQEEVIKKVKVKETTTIRDMILSLVILIIIAIIFGIITKRREKEGEERHQKVKDLGDIFG